MNDSVKQWRDVNKQIDNIRSLPRPNAEQIAELERLQEIKKQTLLQIGRNHCG
jgi:hypothetical protein